MSTGCGTQDQIVVSMGGVLLLEFAAFKEYPRTITEASENLDYFVTIASPGGRTGYDDISGDLVARNESNEARLSIYKEFNKFTPAKIFNALIDHDLTTLRGLSRFTTDAIRHLVDIDNAAILEMIRAAEANGAVYARPSGPRPTGGVMVALSTDVVTAHRIAEALEPLSAFVIVDSFSKAGTVAFATPRARAEEAAAQG